MSTIAEIQRAIAKLTPEQVRELAVWLDELQRSVGASESLFQMYDEEEGSCQSRVAEKSG